MCPQTSDVSKSFAQIYRAQYNAAMLEEQRATPTWQPENSVNLWHGLTFGYLAD